jgi:hypothetical protein
MTPTEISSGCGLPSGGRNAKSVGIRTSFLDDGRDGNVAATMISARECDLEFELAKSLRGRSEIDQDGQSDIRVSAPKKLRQALAMLIRSLCAGGGVRLINPRGIGLTPQSLIAYDIPLSNSIPRKKEKPGIWILLYSRSLSSNFLYPRRHTLQQTAGRVDKNAETSVWVRQNFILAWLSRFI